MPKRPPALSLCPSAPPRSATLGVCAPWIVLFRFFRATPAHSPKSPSLHIAELNSFSAKPRQRPQREAGAADRAFCGAGTLRGACGSLLRLVVATRCCDSLLRLVVATRCEGERLGLVCPVMTVCKSSSGHVIRFKLGILVGKDLGRANALGEAGSAPKCRWIELHRLRRLVNGADYAG